MIANFLASYWLLKSSVDSASIKNGLGRLKGEPLLSYGGLIFKFGAVGIICCIHSIVSKLEKTSFVV